MLVDLGVSVGTGVSVGLGVGVGSLVTVGGEVLIGAGVAVKASCLPLQDTTSKAMAVKTANLFILPPPQFVLEIKGR